MNNRSTSVAVAKAREIISTWLITDPSEIVLENIATDLNLIVVERRITGADARLVCTAEVGVIAVREDIHEVEKKRFAVAHEIGHFVLHKTKSPLTLCTDKDFQDWYENSADETEANAFAAELLMPTELFCERCIAKEPSLVEVKRLAEEFQTSLSATAIRYVSLGKHPCALIASRDGRIIWMSVHKGFPYRILGQGTKLHQYSCANDFFDTRKAPKIAESVSGVAWLENMEIGKNCFVYEEVIPLMRYNMVLSLIWIQKDHNKPKNTSCEIPKYDPEKFTPDGKRYRW